jgi:hypothetical protein
MIIKYDVDNDDTKNNERDFLGALYGSPPVPDQYNRTNWIINIIW